MIVGLIIAFGIAFIIAKVVIAVNGDDGTPWQHPEPDDTHRWQ
jgi:hypothetical protein